MSESHSPLPDLEDGSNISLPSFMGAFKKNLFDRTTTFLTEPVILMIPFFSYSTGQEMIVLGLIGVGWLS